MRYKSYAYEMTAFHWTISNTPVLLSPPNARRNVLRHDGLCTTSQSFRHDATTVAPYPRVQTIKYSNWHYRSHSLTTTYHIVDRRSLSPKFAFQPWYVAQINVRLGRCFVNAASHECRPSWMTSQWSALTNQRPLFHTRYFCNTYEKFHGTFHTCMNSYVEDFIRVSNQMRLKKYVYVKFREWYRIMIHV